MRLVIVSGLSGSGKSVALHELEDIDFYCVDNIPAALLKPFIAHTIRGTDEVYRRTAVGLDARNRPNEIDTIPALVGELKRSGIACEVLFLHASDEVLLEALRRDPAQASARVRGGEPARGHRQRAQAPRADHHRGGPRDRHLEHDRAHAARAHPRARRPRRRGARVAHVRVVRLQARHPGRRGFRVRRAQPAEPVLGPRAAPSHGPRCRRSSPISRLSRACAP